MAVERLRRTIPSMDNPETRERTRRRDLLELRKHLDAQKMWQSEVVKQDDVLNDPLRTSEHERAKRLKAIAARALALTREQAETMMKILDLEDDKEQIERQLAALDH